MKDYILFVHGTYRSKDLAFYKKLCRSKYKIAVDGGYSFFKKSGVIADLVIGDMDSVFSLPQLPTKTTLLSFPVRKDKTDSQLAVEYCIEQNARRIDLVMPSIGQPDHFTANVLLPTLSLVRAWARKGGRFRVINKSYEVCFVIDGEIAFDRCEGHTVSIIPLSSKIILDCSGTNYEVRQTRVSRGETLALRNRIVGKRAEFKIKGEALLWRLHG